MEIVALKKAKDKKKLSDEEKYDKNQSSNSFDKSTLKKELETTKDFHAKSFLICYIVTATSIIFSINPFIGLVLGLVGWRSMKKSNEALRDLGKLYHEECAKRLGELLSNHLAKPGTVIYSALEDERLYIDRVVIDYLLTLPSGVTFAISLRTLLPSKNESEPARVSFDKNKNQLAYRKSKTGGKRYFNPEPIEVIKKSTDIFADKYPEIGKKPFIHLLVIATPITLNIYRDSPIKKFDSETYIYFNDVYIVEESKLLALIESLDRALATEDVEIT